MELLLLHWQRITLQTCFCSTCTHSLMLLRWVGHSNNIQQRTRPLCSSANTKSSSWVLVRSLVSTTLSITKKEAEMEIQILAHQKQGKVAVFTSSVFAKSRCRVLMKMENQFLEKYQKQGNFAVFTSTVFKKSRYRVVMEMEIQVLEKYQKQGSFAVFMSSVFTKSRCRVVMEMENLMLEKYQKQGNFAVFSRPLVLQSRGVELLWKWRI